MAYIGKQPVVGNFVKLDAIVTSATATYNLLNGGVAYFPQTANNCIVSLNGVIQSPTSAYTISGSTIVFDSALTSSDSIDFILVLGDVLSIGTPSDGTVSLTKLSATGTKDSTTFLRGDNTFATAGTAWQSVQTTGFTASAGRGYPCNTTSSAFTVTLPASPSVGDTIILLDYAGTFNTNNLTVNPNGLKIQTQTGNRVFNTNRLALTFTYVDSTQGWLLSSGYLEGTNPFYVPPYSVDFLVIAGGGAGGGNHGGGGGAGGYRSSNATYGSSGGGGSAESSLTVTGGAVYTITVGAGGTGNNSNTGPQGSNSSISGTGITTITSTGGGGGGAGGGTPPTPATTGGSGGGGGGGSSASPGASGTANQGYSGGTSASNGTAGNGGGGGGASAVGGNASGSGPGSGTSGSGGNGVASTITGSSVTRGGGASGGRWGSGTVGTAGTGGGGTGGNGGVPNPGDSTNGTANTGGGGGGGSDSSGTGSNGGSGVVILRMPTANYSGTTTGSPTVSTSGSDTILVYNASGSYTA